MCRLAQKPPPAATPLHSQTMAILPAPGLCTDGAPARPGMSPLGPPASPSCVIAGLQNARPGFVHPQVVSVVSSRPCAETYHFTSLRFQERETAHSIPLPRTEHRRAATESCLCFLNTTTLTEGLPGTGTARSTSGKPPTCPGSRDHRGMTSPWYLVTEPSVGQSVALVKRHHHGHGSRESDLGAGGE